LKLGILVNSDAHLKEVVGLTKAASSKGHQIILFIMDEGVKLLNNSALAGLHKTPGVTMSFCQYSTHILDVSAEQLAKELVPGSQFDNAVMNREADRVIVL
jgi:hypothetical protein